MSFLENELIKNKHVLVCIDVDCDNLDHIYKTEYEHIKNNFCGNVVNDLDNIINTNILEPDTILYLCGNIDKMCKVMTFESIHSVNIVKIFSYNFDEINDSLKYSRDLKIIELGEIPLNINDVGVYFRNIFDPNKNYFDLISEEHQFQTLTDSNKPTNAFRTGIYLSHVENINDGIKFNLLRCSSNLGGPTDNFRETDNYVVNKVNSLASSFFREPTKLNHVLAQIYENTEEGNKKAKIKEHSDKTKDMPRNGLMAFTTFYKYYIDGDFDTNNVQFKKSSNSLFDYTIKDTSVLTRMRFRLKECVVNKNLIDKFDITLYPNSVFIMSLEMNRLYTHEIVPSILPANKIPTRMGYVIRCSKTDALFKDDNVYILNGDNEIKLIDQTPEEVHKLKTLYLKENMTNEVIEYDMFDFSLNKGDYLKPIL